MMLYRCVSAPGTGFGADYFSTGRFTSSSGKNFKMRNFGGVLSNFAPQGVPPGHSAPSPIVHAGKHYTTSTVLSSGEALKKTNSVGVLSNFAPVIAPPFAPGGPLSFPCQLPTANCYCPLPTANCPWLQSLLALHSMLFDLCALCVLGGSFLQASSPKPQAPSVRPRRCHDFFRPLSCQL